MSALPPAFQRRSVKLTILYRYTPGARPPCRVTFLFPDPFHPHSLWSRSQRCRSHYLILDRATRPVVSYKWTSFVVTKEAPAAGNVSSSPAGSPRCRTWRHRRWNHLAPLRHPRLLHSLGSPPSSPPLPLELVPPMDTTPQKGRAGARKRRRTPRQNSVVQLLQFAFVGIRSVYSASQVATLLIPARLFRDLNSPPLPHTEATRTNSTL